MAQNRRRKQRENIARMKNEMIAQGGNMPTDEEVATIKSLLALPHRTEEDWCVIKDIFDRRNLICMEPDVDDSGIDTNLNLNCNHLRASFPPCLCLTAVNDALHRLPPFDCGRTKNPLRICSLLD